MQKLLLNKNSRRSGRKKGGKKKERGGETGKSVYVVAQHCPSFAVAVIHARLPTSKERRPRTNGPISGNMFWYRGHFFGLLGHFDRLILVWEERGGGRGK